MGTLRHRFPADQAGRPASRQWRLSADRCAQAAAVAVRLGSAEARHQGPRDPHRAAGRETRASSRRKRSIPSRSRSTSRWCCSAIASSTTCSPPHDPDFCAPVQGAGRLRRHHRALDRKRPRLCAADRLHRQGAQAEAGRCRRALRASSTRARGWPTTARSCRSRSAASPISCARRTTGRARPSAR